MWNYTGNAVYIFWIFRWNIGLKTCLSQRKHAVETRPNNTCTLFQSESNISFSCRDCSASFWHWGFSGPSSSTSTSCVDCSKFCKDSSLSPCLSPRFRWTGSRDLLSFPSWKALTKAALLCMSVWSSFAILAKCWSHNRTQPKSSSEIKDRYR